MKISVIIPTYNRLSTLQKCLENFADQTFPKSDFELLVVDDGSTDGTRDFLSKSRFEFSLRSFFQSHQGAAKARNYGIQNAKGEVVVFTDDDCSPNREFLEMHWRAHSRENDIVARGPILMIQNFDERGKQKPTWCHWSANFFCTSNASVRRGNLLKAGNFNERFARWEDAEFGYRLRASGLRLKFIWEAFVYHFKPNHSLEDIKKIALLDGQSALQLFRTHPSWRTWLSAGLHPVNLFLGKVFKWFAERKMRHLDSKQPIHGFWRHIIFTAYFVQGLKENQ